MSHCENYARQVRAEIRERKRVACVIIGQRGSCNVPVVVGCDYCPIAGGSHKCSYTNKIKLKRAEDYVRKLILKEN